MPMGTLFLVLFGATLAFWAGSRWRHTLRAFSDHRVAVAGAKSLNKARWAALTSAALAGVVTYIYLVSTGHATKPPTPKPATQTVKPCPTHGTKPATCKPTSHHTSR
jgi:hypothetical protein